MKRFSPGAVATIALRKSVPVEKYIVKQQDTVAMKVGLKEVTMCGTVVWL